jgi:hypothetical protein
MSRFRRHWLGGMDHRIQTMRAVWPARPVRSVADTPPEHVSPPDRQPPLRGVDAVTQFREMCGLVIGGTTSTLTSEPIRRRSVAGPGLACGHIRDVETRENPVLAVVSSESCELDALPWKEIADLS